MPSLNGNWVDLVVLIIIAYFSLDAFRRGFWYLLTDFAAFLGSLILALSFYKPAADLLRTNFNIPASYSNALGFIAVSIVVEIVLSYILEFAVTKLPAKIRENKFNKIFGFILGIGEGILLTAFLLTAVTALPVKFEVKKAVSESKIGNLILGKTSSVESAINNVFGGAVDDALTYFTIEPDSNATIELKNGIDKLTIDEASEKTMLDMVNTERTKRGIKPLTLDPKITPVARDYAMDMWKRQYFSHFNPEGQTVAERFKSAGITYQIVGENLALAPTVQTAMVGLMNSEGHRANILDTRFARVGMGVVDNGIYGKIFVQEFRN